MTALHSKQSGLDASFPPRLEAKIWKAPVRLQDWPALPKKFNLVWREVGCGSFHRFQTVSTDWSIPWLILWRRLLRMLGDDVWGKGMPVLGESREISEIIRESNSLENIGRYLGGWAFNYPLRVSTIWNASFPNVHQPFKKVVSLLGISRRDDPWPRSCQITNQIINNELILMTIFLGVCRDCRSQL